MNNTAKDLEAMMHSVELINRLILLPTLDDEQKMMPMNLKPYSMLE